MIKKIKFKLQIRKFQAIKPKLKIKNIQVRKIYNIFNNLQFTYI